MLDLSDLLEMDIFTTHFDVERTTGEYILGIWTKNAPTISTQIGSITPATANDLIKLPEGERQKETLRLITQYELKISKNSAEADIVIYLGHRYRVWGPASWEGNGFYDVLIQKEDNG